MKIGRPKDRETGKLKNFGFVLFSHAASVPYAIHMINGIKLFDKTLKCQHRNSTELSHYTTVGVHSIECEASLQRCLDGSIEESPEKDASTCIANKRRRIENTKQFTPKPLDANQTWRNNIAHHERQQEQQSTRSTNFMMGPGSLNDMSPNNMSSPRSVQSSYRNMSTPKSASHYHNLNSQILASGSQFDLRSTLSGGPAPVGTGSNYRSTKDDRYYKNDNEHAHRNQSYSRGYDDSYNNYSNRNSHSQSSNYNSYSNNSRDSYSNNGNYNSSHQSGYYNSSGYGSSSSQQYSEDRNYQWSNRHNKRDRSGSYKNDGNQNYY